MAHKFEDGQISAELIPVAKASRIGYQRDEGTDKDKAAKSDEAINDAMTLVYRTAKRIAATLNAIEADKDAKVPGEIEVDFALKLDEEGNATIAHTGSHAHFRVKLKWEAD